MVRPDVIRDGILRPVPAPFGFIGAVKNSLALIDRREEILDAAPVKLDLLLEVAVPDYCVLGEGGGRGGSGCISHCRGLDKADLAEELLRLGNPAVKEKTWIA